MVLLWKKVALRCKWYHFWFHVSCLVHGLPGVWCSFQGWNVGTLGNTLSAWVCIQGIDRNKMADHHDDK